MAGDRSAALRWVAMVAGLILFAGCDDAKEGSAQAKAGPPPPEVTVAKPLVQKLTEWDEFTGRFEAVQQVDIRARVSGYLQEIRFQDGQHVEAGQVLVELDKKDMKFGNTPLVIGVYARGKKVQSIKTAFIGQRDDSHGTP